MRFKDLSQEVEPDVEVTWLEEEDEEEKVHGDLD